MKLVTLSEIFIFLMFFIFFRHSLPGTTGAYFVPTIITLSLPYPTSLTLSHAYTVPKKPANEEEG